MKKFNVVELDSKIDSEGGIEGAICYGITGEDIADGELGSIWDRIRAEIDYFDRTMGMKLANFEGDV